MSQEHNSPIFSSDCDTNLNQANKALVQSMWACMDAITENDVLGSAHPLYDFLIPNVKVYGFDPLGDLIGCDAYVQDYLFPLKHAFPDIQRDIFIFYGGRSNGRQDGNFEQDGAYWVTGTGNLRATFTNDYFGIPATGNKVNIRWGEFCKVEDNRVTEIYFLLDMVDLMQQAGMDVLPPAMGKDGRYAPRAQETAFYMILQTRLTQTTPWLICDVLYMKGLMDLTKMICRAWAWPIIFIQM